MFRNVVRRETAIPALVATLLFCLCLTNTAHSFSFTWHENYLACARRCQTADQSAPEEIRKSCIVNCNFEADRAHMYPSPYYPTGPALAGDDPILPIYRQCLDTCGDKDGPHARAACYRACNKTLQDGGFIAAAEATMQAQDEPAAAPADGQPAVTEEAQGTDAVAEEAAHQEEAIEHEAAEAQDEQAAETQEETSAEAPAEEHTAAPADEQPAVHEKAQGTDAVAEEAAHQKEALEHEAAEAQDEQAAETQEETSAEAPAEEHTTAPADEQPALTEEAQGTDAVAEEAAHQKEAIEHEAAEAQDEQAAETQEETSAEAPAEEHTTAPADEQPALTEEAQGTDAVAEEAAHQKEAIEHEAAEAQDEQATETQEETSAEAPAEEHAAAPDDEQPAVTEEAQGTDAVAEEAAHQEEAVEHEAAEAQDEQAAEAQEETATKEVVAVSPPYTSVSPMTVADVAYWVGIVALYLVMCVAYMRIGAKLGRSETLLFLVPVYNLYLLIRAVHLPAWHVILLLIPFLNLIYLAFLAGRIAVWMGRSFIVYFILTFFFCISLLILAFDPAAQSD